MYLDMSFVTPQLQDGALITRGGMMVCACRRMRYFCGFRMLWFVLVRLFCLDIMVRGCLIFLSVPFFVLPLVGFCVCVCVWVWFCLSDRHEMRSHILPGLALVPSYGMY